MRRPGTASRPPRAVAAATALGTWAAAGILLLGIEPGPAREIALFALAGAVLVSCLAAVLFGAARRGSLSPLQACLLASLLAHLAAGYGMGSWMVLRILHDPAPDPTLETALDSEALAKEGLALRMREERVPIELTADLPVAALPPAPPTASAAPARTAVLERLALPAAPAETPSERASLGFIPVELRLERRTGAPVDPSPAAEPRFPAVSVATGRGEPLAVRATAPAVPDPGPRPTLPPLDLALPAPPELPKAFALRDPVRRAAVLERLGGDAATEAAVERALEWLRRRQEEDGRWSLGRFGGKAGHDVAATGLAILCFTGWGARHDRPGPDEKGLKRALAWIQREMKADGDLTGGRTSGMYDQGIATLALAEAYGMTHDPALLPPLRRAVGLILKAQHPVRGGWRYTSEPRDSDTSVTGWQMMALRAAELAGVEVPAEAWKRAENWLDWVGGGRRGGLYGYVTQKSSPAMTAQGMIGRQILGSSPDEARMKESAALLEEHLPERRSPNFYYWYVASLALYQHQGAPWSKWNAPLKELILSAQKKGGDDAGSWDPAGAWAPGCGRLATTALAVLCLEVYYRYVRVEVDSGETR